MVVEKKKKENKRKTKKIIAPYAVRSVQKKFLNPEPDYQESAASYTV